MADVKLTAGQTSTSSTVYVEGLNKLLRALNKLDEAAKDEFKAVGFNVGKMVAQQAREEVPVRSGRLRGTIRPVKTSWGAAVRAGAARAPYVGVIHFGWRQRNIRRDQFLYRAIDKKATEALDMYLEEVYKIWNRNV
jgi:hypothetical protein